LSDPEISRKHALECMRLASDCMQLVGDVSSPALRSHFLQMARAWSDRADRGPGAGTQSERTIFKQLRYEVITGRDV
jgi:hypothetical protein